MHVKCLEQLLTHNKYMARVINIILSMNTEKISLEILVFILCGNLMSSTLIYNFFLTWRYYIGGTASQSNKHLLNTHMLRAGLTLGQDEVGKVLVQEAADTSLPSHRKLPM